MERAMPSRAHHHHHLHSASGARRQPPAPCDGDGDEADSSVAPAAPFLAAPPAESSSPSAGAAVRSALAAAPAAAARDPRQSPPPPPPAPSAATSASNGAGAGYDYPPDDHDRSRRRQQQQQEEHNPYQHQRHSHQHHSHNYSNNNNSHHHYRMERVLYDLHRRLCLSALRRSSRRTRTAVEHVLLVLAVLCFGVLLLVHWSFVYRGAPGGAGGGGAVSAAAYNSTVPSPPPSWHNSRCLLQIPGFRTDADVTHLALDLRSPRGGGAPKRTTSYAYMEYEEEEDDGAGGGDRFCRRSACRCSCGDDHPQPSSPLASSSSDLARAGSCAVEGAAQEGAQPQERQGQGQCALAGALPGDRGPPASSSEIYYSYSRVRGYLLLPPRLQRERRLAVQRVVVSYLDPRCFGEPFLRRLVWTFTGVDTVLANWFLALEGGSGGYLLNPRSGRESAVVDLAGAYGSGAGIVLRDRASRRWTRKVRSREEESSGSSRSNRNKKSSSSSSSSSPASLLRQLLSKLMVVAKTSFLFFIITTLVSFTLRETQERMIDFTRQLRDLYARSSGAGGDAGSSSRSQSPAPPAAAANLRRPLPLPRRPGVVAWQVAPLVARHLAENLLFVPIMIGMIFFLIEFYRGDKFLAFMVVSLVWLCEVFTVISLRSSQGLHFFPRIFFLLFSLFHFYLFLYPFGFIYTALASTALFMTHSMLFFWHRYELPAVAHGLVTLDNPRMGLHSGHQHQHHAHSALGDENGYGSSGRPANGSSSHGPTPPGIPNILLPARRTATPSLLRYPPPPARPSASAGRGGNTALLGAIGGGGMSRPGSSVALVRGRDEDDDNSSTSSSFLYFMDGEVVVHRRAPPLQHPGHHPRQQLPLQPRQQPPGSRERGAPSAHSTFSADEADGGDDSSSSSHPFRPGLQHPQVHQRLAPPPDAGSLADDASGSGLRGIMEGFGVDRGAGRIPMLDDRSLRAVFGSGSGGDLASAGAAAAPQSSSSRRRELFVRSGSPPAPPPLPRACAPRGDSPEVSSLRAILFPREDGPDRPRARAATAMAAAAEASPAARTTPRSGNRSSSSGSSHRREGDALEASAAEAPAPAPSVPELDGGRRAR